MLRKEQLERLIDIVIAESAYIKQQTNKNPKYLQIKTIPYINPSNKKNQNYTIKLITSVELETPVSS